MGDRPHRRSVARQPETAGEGERQPLLRPTFSHEFSYEPVFSCHTTNIHANLPVYTNIHRIRRDITSVVEDYLSPDQLRDVRINISVVRPLVDKLYDLDDISISAYHPPPSPPSRAAAAAWWFSLCNL